MRIVTTIISRQNARMRIVDLDVIGRPGDPALAFDVPGAVAEVVAISFDNKAQRLAVLKHLVKRAAGQLAMRTDDYDDVRASLDLSGTLGPGFGEGWKPVAAKIKQLPRVVREWIAECETLADPAGVLRTCRIAQDEARFWQAENKRLRLVLEKVAGGHGIPTDLLERAVADRGLLYGWCQSVAREGLTDS